MRRILAVDFLILALHTMVSKGAIVVHEPILEGLELFLFLSTGNMPQTRLDERQEVLGGGNYILGTDLNYIVLIHSSKDE